MPDFQVSLQNPTNPDLVGVEISDDGASMDITDSSNFIESTESGNQLADFATYRKVFITDPNAVPYTFSSLGDGDELISAGNLGSAQFTYAFTPAGDGVYLIRLINLPNYNAGATYQLTDTVYYAGVIYQSLIDPNTANTPGLDPAKWMVIEDELTVNSKYNVFISVGRIFDTEVARLQKGYAAVAGFNLVEGLNMTLAFRESLAAIMLNDVIQSQSDGEMWDNVANLIPKLKALVAA